ncbi:MAG: GNAT family N-acetyltransferase [Peptococcaceae bacterium]
MMVIREAVLEDVQDVVELALDMGYEITKEGIMPVLKHHIDNPDYYLLIADDAGRVVGMVGFNIKYYLHREKPVLYVGSMVVREALRGKGIGRKLMEKVEEIARRRNSNSIQLNSNKRRKAAHQFYEKLGFSEISLKFEKKI